MKKPKYNELNVYGLEKEAEKRIQSLLMTIHKEYNKKHKGKKVRIVEEQKTMRKCKCGSSYHESFDEVEVIGKIVNINVNLVHEDGEIEISFDVKTAKKTYHNLNPRIDIIDYV
jgi:hypothetical protein